MNLIFNLVLQTNWSILCNVQIENALDVHFNV